MSQQQQPSDGVELNSDIYDAILCNDAENLSKLLQDNPTNAAYVNSRGESHLHQAVQDMASPDVIKVLVNTPHVNLSQRNEKGCTALELCMASTAESALPAAQVMSAHVMTMLLEGNSAEVERLVKDGWNTWPIRGVPQLEKFPETAGYLKAGPKMEVLVYPVP